jgi:hypothetical protein
MNKTLSLPFITITNTLFLHTSSAIILLYIYFHLTTVCVFFSHIALYFPHTYHSLPLSTMFYSFIYISQPKPTSIIFFLSSREHYLRSIFHYSPVTYLVGCLYLCDISFFIYFLNNQDLLYTI